MKIAYFSFSFRQQMLAKFAEDDRIELMNAQKRRMKVSLPHFDRTRPQFQPFWSKFLTQTNLFSSNLSINGLLKISWLHVESVEVWTLPKN